MCCCSLRWFCLCVVLLPLLLIMILLLAHPRAWNFVAWMVGDPDEVHLDEGDHGPHYDDYARADGGDRGWNGVLGQ